MAEMKLKVHNAKFRLLAASTPGEETSLVYAAAYEEGDFVLLETDRDCRFCVIQLEDTMPSALVYTPGGRMAFHIPAADKRGGYSPKSFTGSCHLLRARAATAEEIAARRNLALNPYDAGRETGCFPHASSSTEVQGAAFAPRNAIDGIFENNSHGEWPYQAWGINKDPDAVLKLDFGRSVVVDEVRLTLRADFPHDSWWTSVVAAFSDGSREELELRRLASPQSFPIVPRAVEWMELRELKKAPDESEFPALTQLEVFGRENTDGEVDS